MEIGQQVASMLNFSLDCPLKSWSSYLTSIPVEDISSPEVAAVATLVVDLADLAVMEVDFPVARTEDVDPDIYPSDRISSCRSDRTADEAYSTDPDSGSLV